MWPRQETNHWKYDGPTQTYQTKLGAGRPSEVVRKASDETVNNSTTYQNDDALLLAVLANTTWVIEFELLVNTSAVADFKAQLTGPAGSTIYGNNVVLNATGNFAEVEGAAVTMAGTGAVKLQHLKFLVIVGSTAGNLQLQWAQNTLEATDTKVLADSVLKATQFQ